MRRIFAILIVMGFLFLTACGRANPTAQAPQIVEVTKVVTVEVTNIVTSIVVATATPEPTLEATIAQPTLEATATSVPTPQASAVTTTNYPIASVINGGNLRSETNISANTIIGQVCPGDQVSVLTQQSVGSALWYKVQITTTAINCDPKRVGIGTEGWLNSSLVSQPSVIVANTPPTAVVVNTPIATPDASSQDETNSSINQDIQVGDVRWKILTVKDLGSTLKSDNDFIQPKTTTGKFIWIRFEIENLSRSQLNYMGVDMEDGQGRQFTSMDDVFGYIPNEELCPFEQLNANVPKTCQVVFEVPDDSNQLTLLANDLQLFSNEKVAINLGL